MRRRTASQTLLTIDEQGKPRKPTWEEIRQAVYAIVQLIPPGKVTTYKAIAHLLGITPRQVARALAQNQNPIAIPCHRVIRSDRTVGGYTPAGPKFKKKLLQLEGVQFDGEGRVKPEHLTDPKSIIEKQSKNPPQNSNIA